MKETQRMAMAEIIERIKVGTLVIDKDSRIYRIHEGKKRGLAEYLNNSGYYQIRIYINEKYYHVLSHRVIYAYHYGIETLKDDYVIHHIDYDITNNRIQNLAQISNVDNIKIGDGTRQKTREQIMSFDYDTLGDYQFNSKMDTLIAERGLYKHFVAKVLGLTVQQLKKYTTGERYLPYDKAYKLASLLGVNVSDLYEVREMEKWTQLRLVF